MTNLLMSSISYGSYISIIKFLLFVILFFAWLPIASWVQKDARTVGADERFWVTVVFSSGAAAALLWLTLPIFVIGFLLYVAAVSAATAGYVIHRNTLVSDFEKILTPEHIRSIFASGKKEIKALEDFTFITANNNEVPVPEPKTPEFFGFRTAHDSFSDAMRRRVSDIIFTPTAENYNFIYYIDGAAHKQPPIPAERMEHFIYFVKNLADLDMNEKRKPQKGKFTIRRAGTNLEWQLQTAGSTAGEQLHLKLQTQQEVEKLSDLGLDPDQLEQLNRLSNVRQGLFIVSGPRKSGVTTTLYALLRNHDPYLLSISTLEKQPIGNLINISQNIFELSDTGITTYAKKLRSVVNTEPNIIGIADCQDADTAKIALKAAADGMLVYLTLEADNVIQALGKWIKLIGDKTTAAKVLLGISNQRLLRKLCEQCKQAYEPNKELLRKFNIPADRVKALYRAGRGQISKRGKEVVCKNCQGTGFVGRMGIFETIITNAELRKTIAKSNTLSEISTEFRRAKMLYLQEQALRKAVEGKTAINEMVRVLSSKNHQEQNKT